MREMKDSGVEWIGEIPSDWKTARIKQLFTFGKGLPITKDNLVENGVSVISYGQIHSKSNDGIHIQDDLIRYVDKAFLTTNSKSLVKEGDFIFADTSEDIDGCGNCIYIDRDLLLFAGYHTIIFSAEQKGDNRYLGYLFKTDAWRSQIRKQVTGVKLFSISRRILSDVSVIMPQEIGERIRIADYLDDKCAKINSIIEKQQVIIEKLKEYKLSIITEKVSNGLNPCVSTKHSGNEFIGNIPSHWKCLKIKNVSIAVTDGAHVSPETENGVYDFISTVNVEQDHIDFDNCLKTTESSYQYLVSTGCRPLSGDVLISKDGSVGRTAIVNTDRDFVVSSSLVIIRPNIEMITSEYLNFILQSAFVQETLLMLMHGAGLRRVSVNKNANLPVLLPPIEEQKDIVKYLEKKCSDIEKDITKRRTIVEELFMYKKSIIFEVVTGKKEI